ncbi:MAG: hypothetical protein DMD60_12090 [Gemmatimonadetes bacterium]|nr:MAG: hypothetical protein DMD60_12090 [Gemmatimonadota bacterium]
MSGATGLVYELLWVRVLYQTFGSTIQSVTTVVAAYMGGLGLGAWLLGRRADRHGRPAALYGWLEIAIGLFGLASPLVLAFAHRVYIGAASTFGLVGGASVALRFALAGAVLLIPTTLMGGTLPVLTRAFTGTERAELQRSLGLLYGLNTLGAVVGTALAGFFLIEHVGVRASLWGTAAVNLALGSGAIALARSQLVTPHRSSPDPGREPGEQASRALRNTALVLLGLTAFAALLDEIAWTRVLVMIVGGSTYAFTLVLLVFLLGIGIGSALVARRGSAAPETAAAAGAAQALTAAGAALLFLVFGLLPRYIIAVFQLPSLGATERLLAMGLAVGAVVLIPAIGMGMSFPLLTDLVAPRDAAGGAEVGRAYALNTVGSIIGAVLTGFVLVVTLGTDLTLRLGVLVNVVGALALAGLAARGVAEGSVAHRRLRAWVLGAGGLASAALVVALAAPRWSTRLIDLGPSIYARDRMDAHGVAAFLAHRGTRQLAYREGWNATVSVWEEASGRSLKVNGKADASDYGDMDTQIIAGLAPVAARPDPKTAFLVGYGSGVTARVLSDVPGMQRVRVVEIEPAVLDMNRFFLHVNDTALARPNLSAIVDDARSALQLDPTNYDIIVSEPSNPWLAGVATLYTVEFFRIARSRLAEGGVFCQWVQLYQVPVPVVAGVVRNVRAVFPHVHLWFGAPGDVMVVASDRPLTYDPSWIARLVGPTGALGELGREYLGVDRPEDYLGHFLLGEAGVAKLIERPAIVHRDDRPQLEFVAARRFLDPSGTAGVFDSLAAIQAATQVLDSTSPLRLAHTLTARWGDIGGLAYVAAARRAQPDVLRPGRNPEAWLLSGLVAAQRDQGQRARSLFAGALAAGADSAEASAALAALDARDQHWTESAARIRTALRAARNTLRHPYPRNLLWSALKPLAFNGPPAVADSLITTAAGGRDGWFRLHELRTVTALRTGRCDVAAQEFLVLLEFGIEPEDGPALVNHCRRGETR